MYVSAYKAALNRTTLKLSSVKNTSTTYRGGNNQSAWDALDKTMLGKPVTNVSRTNFRVYAQKRGVNWSMQNYRTWKTVYWLYIIEYATRNSQTAVDYTYTAEGYHKGGLGNGVTNLVAAEWSTYNGYHPVIPCGTSDSLANSTGQKLYVIPGYTGTNTVYVARYRGIENAFGEIWDWVDGINFQFLQTQQTAKAYIIDNPNHFADENVNIGKARAVVDVSKTSGYIKSMVFGSYGDVLAVNAGTSGTGSSTYYADYNYSGYAGSYWGWRALLVGGHAYHGSAAGLGCAGAASAAAASVGSRLCFLGN